MSLSLEELAMQTIHTLSAQRQKKPVKASPEQTPIKNYDSEQSYLMERSERPYYGDAHLRQTWDAETYLGQTADEICSLVLKSPDDEQGLDITNNIGSLSPDRIREAENLEELVDQFEDEELKKFESSQLFHPFSAATSVQNPEEVDKTSLKSDLSDINEGDLALLDNTQVIETKDEDCQLAQQASPNSLEQQIKRDSSSPSVGDEVKPNEDEEYVTRVSTEVEEESALQAKAIEYKQLLNQELSSQEQKRREEMINDIKNRKQHVSRSNTLTFCADRGEMTCEEIYKKQIDSDVLTQQILLQENKDLTLEELEDLNSNLKTVKPKFLQEKKPAASEEEEIDDPNLRREFYLSVNSKAGLANTDKNKINQVINEASKHSDFFKSEEEKLSAVRKKVKKYKERVEHTKAVPGLWEKLHVQCLQKIKAIKRDRDLSRTWIHVDMDAFYAACEMRDETELINKPLAIGDKNMIMTTNYCARGFGIRSGVPIFIGRKLCPDLIYRKPDYVKYRKASDEIKAILKQYDSNMEFTSGDEANLDITNYLRHHDLDNEDGRIFVSDKIRQEIREKTRMTASCGIACNKMLSKICSDLNKPDGQSYLPFTEESILSFMKNLPIRKLPGVGKVNEQILVGMGITVCSDAVEHAIDVAINFTDNAFDFLIRSSLGIAKNIHESIGLKKSLNCSETFQPLNDYEIMRDKISRLCQEMEDRCIYQRLKGKTLTLEFKNDKFKNKQKSFTCRHYMDKFKEFFHLAVKLLDLAWPLEPCRQVSVKLLNLMDDEGNVSETPHFTIMERTHGSSKLGGKPKMKPLPNPKQMAAPREVKPNADGSLPEIKLGEPKHYLTKQQEYLAYKRRWNQFLGKGNGAGQGPISNDQCSPEDKEPEPERPVSPLPKGERDNLPSIPKYDKKTNLPDEYKSSGPPQPGGPKKWSMKDLPEGHFTKPYYNGGYRNYPPREYGKPWGKFGKHKFRGSTDYKDKDSKEYQEERKKKLEQAKQLPNEYAERYRNHKDDDSKGPPAWMMRQLEQTKATSATTCELEEQQYRRFQKNNRVKFARYSGGPLGAGGGAAGKKKKEDSNQNKLSGFVIKK